MPEDLGKAVLTLEADGGHFSRSLSTARGEASGFVSSMGAGFLKVGKIAAVAAGAAGIGAITIALGAGIKEWAQSAKVAAQTEAVIKSTGGSANVTAKEVDALAQSIMNKSGIDDEAIKTGENMLLTFSSIRNEVGAGNNIFDQATQAVTDMDVAMTHGNSTQESLSKTAILVGKALNDPIKGATALRRVGVQLTDAQTKQIAAFVKSGDTMKAQKIILAELTKEFGGSAKAMGDTLPGKINILRENFKNLSATMVSSLAPAFTTVIGGLTHFMQRLSAADGFKAKIGVVFDVAKDAFSSVRKSIEHMLFGGVAFGKGGVGPQGIKIDKGFVVQIRDAFAKLNWTSVGKSIMDGVTDALKTAGNLAKQLGATITRAIGKVDWVAAGRVMGPGMAAMMLTAFAALLDPVFWAKNWDLMLAVLLAVFGKGTGKLAAPLGRMLAKPFADAMLFVGKEIERVSPTLAKAFVDGMVALPGLIRAALQPLEGIVRAVFGRLAGLAIFTIKVLGIDIAINALVQFATGPVWNTIRAAFTTLQGVATTTWNAITAGVHAFATGITSAMTAAWNAVRTATTTVLTAITGAVTTAFTSMRTAVTNGMTAIGGAMTTAWNAIKSAASAVWTFVVGTITGAIGRAGSEAKSLGGAIVSGIRTGLQGVMAAVKGGLDVIWGTITRVAGLARGAAVAIGKAIMEGIKSGADALWGSVKGWFVDRAHDLVKVFTLGLHGSPQLFTYYLGKDLVAQLIRAMREGIGGVNSAATALTSGIKTSAVKGMNEVGQMIVAAAKKYGVDAKAALAVAMTEGGIKFGAVGDKGHSFGPFQMADFGALSNMTTEAAKKFANSYAGVDFALRKMAESGAKGLTGLAAIKAIVGGPGWGFERPANAAAEVGKALGYLKTLGPQVTSTLKQAGLSTKDFVAQITAGAASVGNALVAYQAKVRGAKAAFVSAFNELATAALQAFDAKMAAWVPPSLKLLNKMQLDDQLKGVQDSLASAMASVQSGGAAMAADISKTLGPQIADAMSTAFGQIAGAKTLETLNSVSQTAQTQMTDAITRATATATTAAQTAVDTARAALATAQAGGDPDAIAAAQAALDTAVGNQQALEAAVRAEIETATGQLVIAEQSRHDQIAAKTREGMARRLEEEKQKLLDDPKAWDTMGADVQKILADYNVKLQNAGHMWANKFGDGIEAGIPAAVAKARQLAAAVAAVLPSTSSPLKPAKEGPLAFHPYDMGKAWVAALAGGLAAGKIGNLIERSLPMGPAMALPSGGFNGGRGGFQGPSGDVILKVNERELGRVAIDQLIREQGRTAALRVVT